MRHRLRTATRLYVAVLAFCFLVRANVDLPFGDVNVLVVTDVHSWIGGHGRKEPSLNADYGHVVSFYQRLKQHCISHNMDLWFVMNGDWIDGTGLALNGDASHLVPLLEKMPFDAVNIGNHELYRNDIVDYMLRPGGFAEWWGHRLLSSNVMRSDTHQPVGNSYRLLHGSNYSVLTFGFLYNMKDNADHVRVLEVEAVMADSWFESALRQESYEAILVLAHMHVKDELVSVILRKIRVVAGDVPVQFITGHTHIREYAMIDPGASSFEAGRFLDTLGFVSFPASRTTEKTLAELPSSGIDSNMSSPNATLPFQYRYIDANVEVFQTILGVHSLDTEDGKELSDFINRTEDELNLDEIVACKVNTYIVERRLDESDSLWKLFVDEIVPSRFAATEVVFLGKGSWRYALIGGDDVFLFDLVAVSPFNETFHAIHGVPVHVIVALNESMNSEQDANFLPMLPNYILAPAGLFHPSKHSNVTSQIDDTVRYNATNATVYTLITNAFEAQRIHDEITKIYPAAAELHRTALNATTTDVWIDYFREEYVCGSEKGHHNTHTSNPFGSIGHAQVDKLRLGFAIAAVMIVLVSVSVYVRQRGIIFQRLVDQREFATQDALRELEEEEGQFI